MNEIWESTWKGPPLRILLVDDEPTVCRLVGAWLKADGHHVETAADGFEGLELFKAGTWDLMITDRMMPKLSGDDLAKTIKQMNPTLQIILITGSADRQLELRGDSMPFDIIIPKPFTHANLRAAIASLANTG